MLNGLTTYHWDRMCQAMRQRWPRLTIEDTSSIAGNLEALYNGAATLPAESGNGPSRDHRLIDELSRCAQSPVVRDARLSRMGPAGQPSFQQGRSMPQTPGQVLQQRPALGGQLPVRTGHDSLNLLADPGELIVQFERRRRVWVLHASLPYWLLPVPGVHRVCR